MRVAIGRKTLSILALFLWLGSSRRASAQESPFLYGIHDHDTNIQEYLDHFKAGGISGWVTATIAIGSDPANTSGDDFSWIADQGHTVIVRLNDGYCRPARFPPRTNTTPSLSGPQTMSRQRRTPATS